MILKCIWKSKEPGIARARTFLKKSVAESKGVGRREVITSELQDILWSFRKQSSEMD